MVNTENILGKKLEKQQKQMIELHSKKIKLEEQHKEINNQRGTGQIKYKKYVDETLKKFDDCCRKINEIRESLSKMRDELVMKKELDDLRIEV